jgi:hypothetical protein
MGRGGVCVHVICNWSIELAGLNEKGITLAYTDIVESDVAKKRFTWSYKCDICGFLAGQGWGPFLREMLSCSDSIIKPFFDEIC